MILSRRTPDGQHAPDSLFLASALPFVNLTYLFLFLFCFFGKSNESVRTKVVVFTNGPTRCVIGAKSSDTQNSTATSRNFAIVFLEGGRQGVDIQPKLPDCQCIQRENMLAKPSIDRQQSPANRCS